MTRCVPCSQGARDLFGSFRNSPQALSTALVGACVWSLVRSPVICSTYASITLIRGRVRQRAQWSEWPARLKASDALLIRLSTISERGHSLNKLLGVCRTRHLLGSLLQRKQSLSVLIDI